MCYYKISVGWIDKWLDKWMKVNIYRYKRSPGPTLQFVIRGYLIIPNTNWEVLHSIPSISYTPQHNMKIPGTHLHSNELKITRCVEKEISLRINSFFHIHKVSFTIKLLYLFNYLVDHTFLSKWFLDLENLTFIRILEPLYIIPIKIHVHPLTNFCI